MQDKSIYKEHYLGETYRAGVAYLRARDGADDRPPGRVGSYPLDVQRQIIAKAARADRTIIVAEYIEYGDRRGFRPGIVSAAGFASETRIADLYVAREEYLTWRPEDFALLMQYLKDSEVALVPAYPRHRQK